MIERCAGAWQSTRANRWLRATGTLFFGRWMRSGLVLVAFLGFGLEGRTQSKRASLIGDCSSIYVGASSTNEPVRGLIRTAFTTYDGSSMNFPIHATSGVLFSGEVRPRQSSPGAYETDFVRYFYATNGYGEWGSLVLNLPTRDSDTNGLPDFAQVSLSVSTNFSGWLTNDTLGVSVGVIGTLQRSAGASSGLIALQTTSPAYVLAFTNVSWRVSSATAGYFQYTRGATNSAVMRFTLTDPGGNIFDASASTGFTVLDTDTVALAPCQLNLAFFDVNGFPTNYLVGLSGGTLHRTGTRYAGNLTLADGYAATPWPDYANWVFVITDPNDTDGDGIPDLSDAMSFPPVIVVPPQGVLAPIGQTVGLSVSAVGTAPLKYQWICNNAAVHDGGRISGSSTSNLVITGAQLADGGSYTVIVSNFLGAVTSSPPAVVTLLPAPVIFTQPISVTHTRGQLALFNVAAGGQRPLAYQWFLNGAPLLESARLTGTTTSNLTINGVDLPEVGGYSVVITNVVGAVTSQVAMLALDTSHFLPNAAVRFTESWVDRVIASSDGGSIFYDVVPAYQGVVTANVFWDGLSNLAFSSNTLFSMALGHFNYTKFVSDAVASTSNSVTFLDRTFTNDLTGEVLQIGASFTRSGDAGTFILTNTEWFLGTNLYYVVMNYLDTSYNGPVQGDLSVHLRFGPYGTDRTTHYRGTVSFTTNVNASDPLADPYLYTVQVAGTNDIVPPTVQISSPASQSIWASASVPLAGTAADNSGVSAVWLQVNGGAYVAASGTTAWSGSALLVPGSNSIQALAFDLEGNVSTAAVVTCYYSYQQAPQILVPPTNQITVPGGTLQFSVQAAGASPLSFQWMKNGFVLAGATNSTLVLTGVQTNDNGAAFTVRVSNLYGTNVSAAALLTVVNRWLQIVETNLTLTNYVVGSNLVVTVPIRLNAQGNESAARFSLLYDPRVLTLTQITNGPAASKVTLLYSNLAGGVLGLAATNNGVVFGAGAKDLALLSFSVATNWFTKTNSLISMLALLDRPTPLQLQDVHGTNIPGSQWLPSDGCVVCNVPVRYAERIVSGTNLLQDYWRMSVPPAANYRDLLLNLTNLTDSKSRRIIVTNVTSTGSTTTLIPQTNGTALIQLKGPATLTEPAEVTLHYLVNETNTFAPRGTVACLTTNVVPSGFNVVKVGPANPATNGLFSFSFGTTPGRIYYVQQTPGWQGPLGTAAWSTVFPAFRASTNRATWTDLGPPWTPSLPSQAPTRFYRAIEEP